MGVAASHAIASARRSSGHDSREGERAHTGTNRLKKLVASPASRLCWDYGTPLSKGGMYAVCFRRGKVTYTSRIG